MLGMNCLKALAIATIAALYGCGEHVDRAVVKPVGEEAVVGFKPGDSQMEAAEAKAKSTLDQFILRMKKTKGDEYFTVKAGIPASEGGLEYFWLDDTKYLDGKFTGTIQAAPLHVAGLKKGSKVSVTRDNVDDWIINKNGKFEGGFTYDIIAKEAGEPLLPR
jgi:uncharacterized protein YegJ (DUF2314 family)